MSNDSAETPQKPGGTFKLNGAFDNGCGPLGFSGTVEFFEGGDYNATLTETTGEPMVEHDTDEIVRGVFLTLDEQGIVV